MNIRFLAGTAAFAFAAVPAFSNPAHAAGLAPVQDQAIDLGAVAGDAYYTVEQDGFHVTATLTQRGGAGTPVRFQALLAPGQSITLSSPRGEGTVPASVEISRQADRVLVRKVAVVD